MTRNTTPLEADEQISFVEYCAARNIRVVSTQNGFKMPKNAFNFAAYSNKLKKMGLSKGFPDLIVFAKNSEHEVLFLEMKRQKGGKLRDVQKEWIEFLDRENYAVGVAYGCDSAIRILNKYLEM